MYDAIEDPYTYKNSTVLVNKLDLQIRPSLRRLRQKFPAHERRSRYQTDRWTLFTTRLSITICFKTSITGRARFATVRIAKGGNPFCFPENIEGQANKLFGDLQSADHLRNLDTQTFANKAAHFLAELNAIHAFREGNGRSQLTFFALLADHAGHPLKIEKLNPDEMLAAMIASFDGDERRLADVIHGLIE